MSRKVVEGKYQEFSGKIGEDSYSVTRYWVLRG